MQCDVVLCEVKRGQFWNVNKREGDWLIFAKAQRAKALGYGK